MWFMKLSHFNYISGVSLGISPSQIPLQDAVHNALKITSAGN